VTSFGRRNPLRLSKTDVVEVPMLPSPGFRVLIGSVLAVFFGCGGIEELPEASPLSSLEQAELDERPPPNGANGTRPSCFWAHGSQQALRSLGGVALDQGQGQLPNIPLTQVSADCREVLRSAVECALTRDQSVTDPVTGARYTGWWAVRWMWTAAGS
jgi:hypothetical protein